MTPGFAERERGLANGFRVNMKIIFIAMPGHVDFPTGVSFCVVKTSLMSSPLHCLSILKNPRASFYMAEHH